MRILSACRTGVDEFSFVEFGAGRIPSAETPILVPTLEERFEMGAIVECEIVKHNRDLDGERRIEVVVVEVLESIAVGVAEWIEHQIDCAEQRRLPAVVWAHKHSTLARVPRHRALPAPEVGCVDLGDPHRAQTRALAAR
jgi:hypothetical protein